MEMRTLGTADYDALFALWTAAGLTSLRPDGRDGRREFEAQMKRGIQPGA